MTFYTGKRNSQMEALYTKRVSIWAGSLCTIVMSCYFFPFGFNFFMPKSFNTKIGFAVIGALVLAYRCIVSREIAIDKELIAPLFFVVMFSLICFIAVDYNYTSDYTYATYFLSFFTWLSAAYSTYWFIRIFHKKVTFKLLVFYLACACVLQCALALLIDNVDAVKLIVDQYISQATIADSDFLNEVKRLYGIGAALDPAGTRFSIVLLAIGAVLAKDISADKNKWEPFFYWGAFFFISFVGNIISRTTIIGMSMGLLLYLIDSRIVGSEVKISRLRSLGIMVLILACAALTAIYLYSNDADMKQLLRYGFEGFFNWFEKGEWETGSTNLLMNAWIWPHDRQGWIIGYGLFDNWVFGTDIGYCRFVLYCGLTGMLAFSLFFVCNTWVCSYKFPSRHLFLLLLLLLCFIIWVKVSTDLFLIYALLFCLENETAKDSYSVESKYNYVS